MKAIIFGGAGFIGSELAKKLHSEGSEVTAFDSLYTGKMENIAELSGKPGFAFVKGDARRLEEVKKAIAGHDVAYHLAANADIRGGMENTFLDMEYNTVTTYNVLEAMRKTDVRKLMFTSSSAVYGEPLVFPTPETYGPLRPTSLYGASKLAAEAYVSAFCEDFGMQSFVFRFVNILGSKNNHGVVGDFIRKLKASPKRLEILGNGLQRKSGMHISDCLSGIEAAMRAGKERTNIYNIGNDDWLTVNQIADEVVSAMKLSGVEYSYTGGDRGWTGDMPVVFLDNKKLRALGWKPSMNSAQAVFRAATEMLALQDIADKHKEHF
ncbi:MAG: NAD-dependent epimerase/dehydratase family protein [Candidatus Micrarchaeia archaeon]|jgi:UDP-glucose 4-epimerase